MIVSSTRLYLRRMTGESPCPIYYDIFLPIMVGYYDYSVRDEYGNGELYN